MPRRLGTKHIDVPDHLKARLEGHRAHSRQALWQVVEIALDHWEGSMIATPTRAFRAGLVEVKTDVRAAVAA